MVTYIKSDLEFILKQIKISEAHASGQPLYGPGGLIPSYNLSWGLRTVDGTYNNLLPGRSEDGASDNPFPTLLTPEYRTIMVDPDGPGGMAPMPVSYQPGVDNDGPGTAGPSDVFDPYVRTISNLIVDQTLGNPSAILTGLQRGGMVAPADEMTALGTITAAYELIEAEFLAVSQTKVAYFNAATTAAANPGDPAAQQAAADALAAFNDATAALTAVRGPLDALLTENGIVLEGDNVQIKNVAPDEGLSAPFNSWFTLFGQFFDHGLDLVAKGGAGTVFIPLMPDDPLYVPGSSTNFMVLTRATLDENGEALNTTTAFVDQNQTYASHASHQVFLRQYEFNGAGDPVNTGHLIEGSNSGMATWADLKEQASDLLGIWLRDQDVGNVPLLATDEYGNFIPGPNGFPQVVFPGPTPSDPPVLVEGNPAANGGLGISIVGAIQTGHAFLADIAHSAVPDGLEDGDIEIGLGNGDGSATDGFYDNELLDAHFMAGDGRVNENIGLTAVHHVFHSEHNRLVEHTKAVTLADAQAMLANGASQAEAVAFLNEWLIADVATVPASTAGLVWDGARLFQAAKFGTEMQYQHLVFEEFARKVQPAINAFLVPDGYDVTIDPSIVAEFAHVVYRFGHSMLTETIDRFDPTMTSDQISLIEGFLNPLEFQNNGGASTVDADIAAGAIIRGMTRQAGNQIDEFVTSALRNNLLGLPLDLATINLARGRDTGVPSLNEARREFYEATQQNILLKPYESWVDFASHLKNEASIINFIAAYGDHELITSQTTIDGKRDAALTIITGVSVGGLVVPADRLAFLNASGPYAGGVANSLGGLETVDLWIGGLAEETMPFGGMLGSTFNFVFEIQMEKLQSGDRFYYLQRLDGLHLFGEMENNSFAAMAMRNTDATHLPSDVFSTPGLILEVDQTKQFNDTDGDGLLDSLDPVGSGILTQLVVRSGPNNLRYNGDEHVVLGGTAADNVLTGGIGDDTLFGDAGNDRLDGGFGNDILNGGDGDDIIVDAGGDDNIKAGDGNDVVHAGPGLDLVMGGAGQDFIFLGTDEGSEVFAGEGNDFIFGNRNAERILGNEGNDWIETGTFDGAPGDNFDEIFAHDSINGHDVFIGDGGFDEFIGEGGDDIMVGSPGRGKMVGMSGFDWATYKDSAIGTTGVNADLSIPIVFDEAPIIPENAALDEYQSIEGLSGSAGNDILKGSNILAEERLPFHPVNNVTPLEGYQGSALNAEGIALIDGLQELLGAGVTSFSAGDIILGGDGSDMITGQMGDDIIDGDKWLDVQIGVFAPGDTNHQGTPISLHKSMTELASAMFAGTINPGQLSIVRTIRTADGSDDVDTAVFADVLAAYTITNNDDGSVTVAHTNVSDGLESDGVDTLWNIEALKFADVTLGGNVAATGAPVVSDLTPTEGQQLSADTSSIGDGNGLGAFSYQWQSSPDGTTWANIAGATAAAFTPANPGGQLFGAQAGLQLRVVVTFTDGAGNVETVTSGATGPTGVNWVGNAANNILNGTDGDDIGAGNNGSDQLYGNDGADTLSGGGGADTLDGGDGDDVLNGGGAADQILGGAGNDTMNGDVGGDTLDGGLGDDTIDGGANRDFINGGAGNDVINHTSDSGGRDFVDGGADTDTYQLNGVAEAEVFRIYTRAAWDAVAGNNGAALNANTEIVITRNGTNLASVIAELDNIEEIGVNALDVTTPGGAGGGNSGGDQIIVIGDFTATSLDFNTITIEGTAGDDIVDISSLSSAHRIVFKSNGGNDTIIGTLRPQDVIEMPDGSDYTETTGDDGVTTRTLGASSVSYLAHDDDEEEDDDDDHDYDDDDDDDAPAALGQIVGTPQHDVLVGTSAGDLVFGYAGTDFIVTGAGADVVRAGAGDDLVDGQAGRDILLGEDGDDDLFGGGNHDMLDGGAGEDRLFGQHGNDLLEGGEGNDLVFGGTGNDTIVASLNDGDDTYYGGDVSADDGIDMLDMGFLTVDATVDLGTGVGGRGSAVSSQSGADTLWGIENVTTGAGNDTITMSNAVNVVDGGQGEDVFVFGSAAAANGDTIRGFEPGDKIDLSGIDANGESAGNDTFTLESGQATTAPGQIVVTHETREDGEYTVISGDTAGNNVPEFRISIAGNHALTESNFVL